MTTINQTAKDSSTLCTQEGVSAIPVKAGDKLRITRLDNNNSGVFTVKGRTDYQLFFQEKTFHALMEGASKAHPVKIQVDLMDEEAPAQQPVEPVELDA